MLPPTMGMSLARAHGTKWWAARWCPRRRTCGLGSSKLTLVARLRHSLGVTVTVPATNVMAARWHCPSSCGFEPRMLNFPTTTCWCTAGTPSAPQNFFCDGLGRIAAGHEGVRSSSPHKPSAESVPRGGKSAWPSGGHEVSDLLFLLGLLRRRDQMLRQRRDEVRRRPVAVVADVALAQAGAANAGGGRRAPTLGGGGGRLDHRKQAAHVLLDQELHLLDLLLRVRVRQLGVLRVPVHLAG